MEQTNKPAATTAKSALELAMGIVKSKTGKKGGSGKITYLDRFVGHLTDKEEKPLGETAAVTREEISAKIALDICQEEAQDENRELDLTTNEAGEPNNPEDQAEFLKVYGKTKAMVAAAVSNSQNATALSYNERYKTKFVVVKKGHLVWLREWTEADGQPKPKAKKVDSTKTADENKNEPKK